MRSKVASVRRSTWWTLGRLRAGWPSGLAVALVLLLVTALAPGVAAEGDTLDDKQRAAQQRASDARRQYELLRESVEDLSADLAQAVLTLKESEAQLPAVQAALEEATRQAESAQRQAAVARAKLQDATDLRSSLQVQIAQDSTRQSEVRATVAQLARDAYRGGRQSVTLEIAIGATSVDDYIDQSESAATAQRLQARSMTELAELQASARNSGTRLEAVVGTLSDLETAAAEQEQAAEAAMEAQREKSEALTRAIADQTAAAQRLESMKGQAEAEQAETDAIRAAAEAEIAQIAAQEEAAAKSTRPSTPSQPAPPGGAGPASGGPAAPRPDTGILFSNPTSIEPMYVTSNYGMRLHPILGYYRLHAGIDLRTYCNTPLYAPRDGTVQWSEWRNGFGNQVMLNYGTVDGQSLLSSSNHLTRSVVSRGQQVSRGQLIGYSGNTGLSGACHLHFEVYLGGKTVDPAPLLGLR
ncbi:peptidoglycan DD-metalloendopeptidase family protein [Cellulomonas hominis]